MRIVFFLLLIIHGLVHVLGFVKAYSLLEVKNLNLPISKPAGAVWAVCTALFLLSAALFVFQKSQWWIPAFAAVALSQIVIFASWQDAKMGTVANLIIALVAIAAFSEQRFERYSTGHLSHMALSAQGDLSSEMTGSKIDGLPAPVRRWLELSGALNDPNRTAVYMVQKTKMKMEPEASKWNPGVAKQVIRLDPPGFAWTVQMQMNPITKVAGLDKFEHGKGEMQMKLWSLIPVVNEKNNPRIDLGSMQRYLGEIAWLPQAALHPQISWKGIDAHSAVATFRSAGAQVSGTFTFGADGLLKSFSTNRYMGGAPDAQERPWTIEILENADMDGLTIPIKLKATWTLESGDWTWLEIEVTSYDTDRDTPTGDVTSVTKE